MSSTSTILLFVLYEPIKCPEKDLRGPIKYVFFFFDKMLEKTTVPHQISVSNMTCHCETYENLRPVHLDRHNSFHRRIFFIFTSEMHYKRELIVKIKCIKNISCAKARY